MVDNLEGALRNEWNTKDLKILTSQIKDHESLLRLKRRWLMDLPLSVTELKKMEEILPPNDKVLPESFIREDDVSYKDIRTVIEMGFEAHSCGKERQRTQEDVQVFNQRECLQKICSLLDDMSNKGLCSLIEVLTGGMINFEKTNLSMKRTIKELLPKLTANRNNISKTKLKQISQLLQDPKNFKGGQLVCSTASEAYRVAAIDVLDRLTDFHWRARLAMHRKLNGVKSYVPTLHPPRSGQSTKELCRTLKHMCMKFLSDLRDVDEPAEELAGALGVAGLTLKLLKNCPDVRDFRKFSPEIEALQNDIAKAIHLINLPKRVSLIELKKVQVLLDPNLKLSDDSLRNAVRGLLTEYLFECSDMGSFPDSLVEAVNIINTRSQFPSLKKRRSSKSLSSPQEFMGDVIQKEVEHVLTVSALAKEVVLNIIPEHEFDEDFARAYLEDFAGNNYLCISDDERVGGIPGHYELHSSDSYDGKSESIGETKLVKSGSPSPTSKAYDDCSPFCSPDQGLAMSLESMHILKIDWDEADGSDCSLFCKKSNVLDASHNGVKSEEGTSSYSTNPNCVSSEFLLETDIVSQHSRSCNKYLQVQEACDASSMVAYRFVGSLLDKLADIEGLKLCKGNRLYLGGDSSGVDDSEVFDNRWVTDERDACTNMSAGSDWSAIGPLADTRTLRLHAWEQLASEEERNDWQALLEKDELKIEQKAGRVFEGWEEGKIYFAPTYKYLTNSDNYVIQIPTLKDEHRTPAW
ncbi:inositol polyphosphate 5-phosphatase I [Striga asiatica]|uniref:Inositol polyphosphate 5-phosphatase I n=1 Tax=Striga asiatica TaxID=4170 RepID=A0A5A7RJE2_STRAF|nr:inositol polyphosphate 5-phosphatase I [Striga asiatica]